MTCCTCTFSCLANNLVTELAVPGRACGPRLPAMGSLARQGTLSKDAGSGLFSLTLDELQNEIVGSGKFLGSMNMVSTRLACSTRLQGW